MPTTSMTSPCRSRRSQHGQPALAVTVTNATTLTSPVRATASVAENTTAVMTVTASDPDAATTFTYAIAGGADAAKFNINSATGALTFATAPDYESPTDVGADNVYNVTVQVSEGTLTANKAVAVTVTNVNEAPTLTSAASASVAENTTAVMTVTASTRRCYEIYIRPCRRADAAKPASSAPPAPDLCHGA